MLDRAFKLRFRRRLRLRKHQVEAIGQQAEYHLERDLLRRLERLRNVRRFVAGWLVLLLLLGGCNVVQMRALGGYYQTLQPVPGGTFTEGMMGSFTNVNPMYATSGADQAVSRLVFSGLYTYNDKNQLVGDLADGLPAVDATGTVYTVTLKKGVTWHDGQKVTIDDILYTYKAIQNADAQSPLNGSWSGIKIAAAGPQSVSFTLPNPLASFRYSLTNGIVPKHILGDVPMSELRSAAFNTRQPIGSGPFTWGALEVMGNSSADRQQRIALHPFEQYYGGRPKLGGYVFHIYHDQDSLIKAFNKHEITAISGLDSVPKQLKRDAAVREYNIPYTAAVMTFFRTTDGVLQDVRVRQALVLATDTKSIIASLGHPAVSVTEPLLKGQVAYNPAYQQAGFNVAAAKAQLDAMGWTVGKNGIRQKQGVPLSFQLFAEDTGEYSKVAKQLQDQWRAVGVDAQLSLQGSDDFQSTLAFHSYDALLYGISIGIDPDVYAYWASTQADMRSQNRLNFSEYKSNVADAALEAGRTRLDPQLRAVKYEPFLKSWQEDVPALGLYQPRLLLITRGPVFGLDEKYINVPTDRYKNVQNWMIRQRGVSQSEQ
ncbi:MAG TPA: ABC transporter substrate-binding protein [Candidatus Saccharimonadales bacterium]|nr:ABC transporter substrate-binding protein [Candidatus Saccharimonadales bacterium]